jgi:hypothetical protein
LVISILCETITIITLEESMMMNSPKPVGILEIARENLECCADSMLQQKMLQSVVTIYKSKELLTGSAMTQDQLELLWTTIADAWELRGMTA